MFDTDEVKKFLELIQETDIEELVWERDGKKVSFVRTAKSLSDSKAAKTSESPAAGTAKPEEPEAAPKVDIRAPMVGTFYRASSVDHPPYVVVGTLVTPGMKVAVVEAMKIMKDVTATSRGKITKVLVESGHPVEYGQELFWVEPQENGTLEHAS